MVFSCRRPLPFAIAATTLLLQPAAAIPDCHTFEAYMECGVPEEEFRNPAMDQGCDEFVASAGYCVCTEGLCTDDANLIRVEIDCPPPGMLERAELLNDPSRNCTSICAKHESNMWMFGVMSSCGASFATAAGLIIQKKAQMKNQALAASDRPFSVGGFILAPLWMAGFLLICLVPLPFNLMAVTWAAASLVAPLASVTLVLNQILAPAMLGETLGRLDIVGTVVIVSGVVMATIFGSHCESSYTAEDLLELYTRTPFLIVAAACFALMGVALTVIRGWRKGLPEDLTAEDIESLDGGAPMGVCISYAFMAGTLGALMQIFFKGVGELVGAGQFDHWALWVFMVLVVFIAAGQMSYLNKGMAVCNAVVFFPTYNACFIVMTTMTGMIYYEEYKVLHGVKVWAFFAGGVSCVIMGVLILTRKTTSKVVDVIAEEVSPGGADGDRPPSSGSEGGEPGSRSLTPQKNQATPLQLQAFQERRGSFNALMMTSSGILVPPSPTVSTSGSGSNSRPGSRHVSPQRQPKSFAGDSKAPQPGLARSVSPSDQMAVGVPAYAAMSGIGPQAVGGHIAQGQPHYGGQQLPTIPGGDTPFASLTAEDAAAFMKLSATQRERAGQLSQAELDMAIQVGFSPLFLQFSIGKCRNCPFFRAFK